MPNPAEIAEACRRIREGWSEVEHRKRAGVLPPRPVEVQVVKVEALAAAETGFSR